MTEVNRGRVSPEDFKVPEGGENTYWVELETTIFHRTTGVKQSSPFIAAFDAGAWRKFEPGIEQMPYDHYVVLYDPTKPKVEEVPIEKKEETPVAKEEIDPLAEMAAAVEAKKKADAAKAAKRRTPPKRRTPKKTL